MTDNYFDRLRNYEAEKRLLTEKNLTPKQYQAAVKKLAEKWRV